MAHTARRVATYTWGIAAVLSLALLGATALRPTSALAMDDHYETAMGHCNPGVSLFYTVANYDGTGAYTGSSNFYGCFTYDQSSVYICDGDIADSLAGAGENPNIACGWYDAGGEWPGGVNPREEEPDGLVIGGTPVAAEDQDAVAAEDAPFPRGRTVVAEEQDTVAAADDGPPSRGASVRGSVHAVDASASEEDDHGA